ncbi:Protein ACCUMULATION AND REPLICATION OF CHLOROPLASTS 3 [Acorus gramineus]|uniref:Protein ACCUMULATION AND REPLICATION OF CHLOROPLASTS 3 n=1 Tax=Acorus gramineus TaxID=55184 RepID=A0AAV9ADB4_ACOGR|nr:Protein ACCUMULATION AND REPLICATION OF CHLOROPLASTS 3 [Acorus gramineus]
MEVLSRVRSVTAIASPSRPSHKPISFNGRHFSSLSSLRFHLLRRSHAAFASPPLRLRSAPSDEQMTKSDSSSDGETRLDGGGPVSAMDVVVIGSRKDAIVDFCLESAYSPSRLRFWTIHSRDSEGVQLLHRCLGEDVVLKNLEYPISQRFCPPAIVLVASAGYGLDYITAVELLSAVKSTGGLAVAILLKPFSFEGQKRQQEVGDLLSKLQGRLQFSIVVEADALLKKEVVTLEEALKSANNAEIHLKLIVAPHGQTKEIKVPEVLNLLESYGDAKVGFGAGYSIKSSIVQAIECPFLMGTMKIIIMPCTGEIDMVKCDMNKELIAKKCFNVQKISEKTSLLSGLVQRFPFLLSLLRGDHLISKDNPLAHSPLDPPEGVSTSSDSDVLLGVTSTGISKVDNVLHSEEVEAEIICKMFNGEDDGVEPSKASYEATSTGDDLTVEDGPAVKMGIPRNWNVGPGFLIAQQWAKEQANLFQATSKADKLDVISLPVGVKSAENSQRFSDVQLQESEVPSNMAEEMVGNSDLTSWDTLADASFEAIMDAYSSASTLLKGKDTDALMKKGLLSARAASMLEAERETAKRWSPILEMPYRAGIYKGRCQGGLPEGKGRLIFSDRSFYDGMWHNGKRSGLGAFYYSNGDVFQGSWRDDLMHGKGWFYFRNGDRWFSNFWKGKANGEGRFYSKSGSIFFGQFQDGWRHGQCLHIDSDGSRWSEIWDKGVLVSRTQLDVETKTGDLSNSAHEDGGFA